MDREEHYWTTAELARHFNIATGTWRRWRSEGHGPHFVVIGTKAVRYADSDVRAWFAEQDGSRR